MSLSFSFYANKEGNGGDWPERPGYSNYLIINNDVRGGLVCLVSSDLTLLDSIKSTDFVLLDAFSCLTGHHRKQFVLVVGVVFT